MVPTLPLAPHVQASQSRLAKSREALTKDFDPDQPRAPDGRWISVGSLLPGDRWHVPSDVAPESGTVVSQHPRAKKTTVVRDGRDRTDGLHHDKKVQAGPPPAAEPRRVPPGKPSDRSGREVGLGHKVSTPSGVDGRVTGVSGPDHVSVDYKKPGDRYATAHAHKPSELKVLDTVENSGKDEEAGRVAERGVVGAVLQSREEQRDKETLTPEGRGLYNDWRNGGESHETALSLARAGRRYKGDMTDRRKYPRR